MAGPAALLLVASKIAFVPRWTPTEIDAVYCLLTIAIVLARIIDARRFGGTTADGSPLSRRALRGWMLAVTWSAASAWAIAQSLEI
jgi:hypothetical protein